MQTFGSRRGPISIFFFYKCIIIVGYILNCWEVFRKPEANENITFLAFKSSAGTERNVKKSLALRMTVKTWMLTLVSPRKFYPFLSYKEVNSISSLF